MATRFTHPPDSARPAQSGRVVSSHQNYAEAERDVDYLADNGFPVERVTIVGRGLEYVEQVTGRMGYGEAVLRGLVTGGLVGLLIGWLFAIFNWFDPVVARGWLIFDALWFGMVTGALFSVLAHALLRGRRDFSSVPAMRAERYEVLVDEEVADEAQRILSSRAGAPAAVGTDGNGRG
jgi:hypothetical protein